MIHPVRSLRHFSTVSDHVELLCVSRDVYLLSCLPFFAFIFKTGEKKKSTHFSFIILQKKISSANWVNRTKEIVAFKKEKKEGKRDILSRSF